MKSTLLRLSALVLTFTVGVTILQVLKSHRSIELSLESPLSEVGSVASSRCPSSRDHLVISVPNDGEFYFGKRKIALAEIQNIVRKEFGDEPPGDQVVFIKSAANVRFETLSLVADQLRHADVNRIEYVLDKKKS